MPASAAPTRLYGRRADGIGTRQAILTAAVNLATVDGLEGLSIGNLAAALTMSKSGVYAHFASKEQLQLATVDEAGRIFQQQVVAPALAATPGLAQLAAFCEAFFQYLERRTLPGGCFFAATVLEMGHRSGPVKDKIAQFQTELFALTTGFAATAVARGELPVDQVPAELAVEINGLILAADARFVLQGSPRALDIPRDIAARRLGRPPNQARS